MRTNRSTPSAVWKTTGHVVSGGTFCKLATLRRSSMFPRPIERGSAIRSHWTSWAGLPSSSSPVASVRIVTPGSTHGSSGGDTTGGTGVTSLLFADSPIAFTAVTVYVYVVPAVIAVSVYCSVGAPTLASSVYDVLAVRR